MEAKATPSGLVNITGLADWSRTDRGGVDSEGNAIYYEASPSLLPNPSRLSQPYMQVLQRSAELATYAGVANIAQGWLENATSLKTAFNNAFYDESQGLYTDNASTTFVPQDGNVLALLFNLTESAEQANNISEGLARNWNDIGAIAPESPDTIAPFIGGFEVFCYLSHEFTCLLNCCRRFKLISNPGMTIVQWISYVENGVTCYIPI